MASLPDCYVLLGLSPYASRDDVTAAYRLLIQVWHPDRFEGQPRIRAQAEEKL
jgi:curved DNA-binding protein CbpA